VPLDLSPFVALATELQLPQMLEEMLQRVVDRAAQLVGTSNASIRIFDASKSRLLVGCRAGKPLHANANFEFERGQGLLGWIGEHGRPLRTGRAQDDPRFMPRPDMTRQIQSFLGVPLVYEGHTIGVLSAADLEPDHFSEEHEQLLVLLAGLCTPHLEVARLARLARVDPVTGTITRQGLDESFPETAATSDDVAAQLSVALVDVDSFKLLNRTGGHAAGDEVLKAVGRILAGGLRVGDAVVRYGGDEFLLLIPGVGLTSASRVAERLRQAVERTPVAIHDGTCAATVCIGVAQRRQGEPRDALIARARLALDEARRRGNCVQFALD
jgi:diguanylate cyclase (GGDEF)-like protein